jgi:hypothetical protein
MSSCIIDNAKNYFDSTNNILVKSCLSCGNQDIACLDYSNEKSIITNIDGDGIKGKRFGLAEYIQPDSNTKLKKFVGSARWSEENGITCPAGHLLTGYDIEKNKPICDFDLNSSSCVTDYIISNDINPMGFEKVDFVKTCSNDIDVSYCPELIKFKTHDEFIEFNIKLISEIEDIYKSKEVQDLLNNKGVEILGNKVLPGGIMKKEFPELYKKLVLTQYLKEYSNKKKNYFLPNFGYDSIPICANYVKPPEPVQNETIIAEEILQKEDEQADEPEDENKKSESNTENKKSESNTENKKSESNTENKKSEYTEVKTLNLRVLYFLLLVIVVLVLINKYVLIKNFAPQNF